MYNYTPDNINSLKPNEVFVFGSNEAGIHGAGAAKLALQKFGAIWGKGFGHHGQSFAIPTKDKNIKTLELETINYYIREFFNYAEQNTNLIFYVTQLGCGLAGYKPLNIAPFFKNRMQNIILPEVFIDIIQSIE